MFIDVAPSGVALYGSNEGASASASRWRHALASARAIRRWRPSGAQAKENEEKRQRDEGRRQSSMDGANQL
jgi:hypothetical protein